MAPKAAAPIRVFVLLFTAALLAATPSLAVGVPGARLIDQDEGQVLLTAGGVPFHRTPAAVLELSTARLPGSAFQVYTWKEAAADGTLRSFYAVSRDGATLAGRVRETGNRVELADYRFDPLESEPLPPAGLRARPGERLFLVQLVATALPELQQAIADLGGTIHRYYTEHTLLVEMDGATRNAVADLPIVRWVGPYHPAFRLAGVLREALESGAESLGEQRYSIMLLERGPAAQAELSDLVRALGGKVEIYTPEGFRMEATLGGGALEELIHSDLVHYVDRWGGPAQTDMDIVRQVGGADYLEGQTGFSGEGVRGEILDTELLTTHQEWANAPIIHSTGNTGSLHGTSVYSNVFAQGTNAPARGMCPDGQGIFFLATEVTQFGGAVTRYTIAEQLIDPLGPYRGVFQTSSVGNLQTTAYTTISAEMDDVLFQHQVIHTQSQSNTGNQTSRPQAWAKNIVSVGGFRHQGTADRSDDAWSGSASIGPAADGRIKPDLSFFYDGIFSARGSGNTAYTSFGGTSSATPQTAGHFGMFFQMWHEGIWTGHGGGATVFDSAPHMATAKAMMIHHAHRYDWNVIGPNSDLDRFKQGWGTADLANLYDNADSTSILDESEVLAPMATYSKSVIVGAGEEELKATLFYVDPMGTPGAMVHRINDLSLKVTSPSNVIYWGNNGLTASNASTSGGVSNTVDTVENVFIPNPETGTWTVEVIADEVVQDSHLETPEMDADFALIISPDTDVVFTDGFESGNLSAWTAVVP